MLFDACINVWNSPQVCVCGYIYMYIPFIYNVYEKQMWKNYKEIKLQKQQDQ